MNFTRHVNRLRSNLEAIRSSVESELAALDKAEKKTAEFLGFCTKAGITKVAVGAAHKSVPVSEKHTFALTGSVFSAGNKRINGRPAIWHVCEQAGISYGCGNHEHHQIRDELIDGVYHHRAGVWHRLKDAD